MERRYTVVIEQDEDGVYIASIPSLPGVVEQGQTEDEAFDRVKEAATFTLNSMTEEGEEIPDSDLEPRKTRELDLAIG